MKVVTAGMMRKLDERTIRGIGIPGAVLMENAGRGAVRALLKHCPEAGSGRAVVLAGRGNNGGDGHVIARILHDLGAEVTIVLLADAGKVTGDARINLDAARRMGVPIVEAPNRGRFDEVRGLLSPARVIVDAMLGTGLSKDVRGVYARAVEIVNGHRAFVLAVDLPTGLSVDTGRPLGCAVSADLTVTFGLPKLAHVTFPGLEYCGVVEVVDIGIPKAVVDAADIPCELVEEDMLSRLAETRPGNAHKGNFGHLLVLAGSTGFTGAGVMAARGAARMGAGLVTLGCPRGITAGVEARLLDAMTLPLPQTAAGSFSRTAATKAIAALKGKTALAIGPGISTADATRHFAHAVLTRARVPAVVDADALNCLAGRLTALRKREAPTILTPHPGEMARLMRCTSASVQKDRIGSATSFAKRHGVIVLLKGARSVTAAPDGRVFINPTGNPGLAAGGSGDVLTGMIAGLLAQGEDPVQSTVVAAFIHGLAADRVGRRIGWRAMVPGDVLEELPAVLGEIENGGARETKG